MNRKRLLSTIALIKEGLGPRRRPNLDAFRSDMHLAGRNWGGNQKRSPSLYGNQKKTGKIRSLTMEMVKEVKRRGRTATGQNPSDVENTPTKPELTVYH